MIAVKAMPHEKFFVVSGKPNKLTLRAPSAEVAAEWVQVLKKELSATALLVSATQGPRGRRALSMLGEAGERLADSAFKELGDEQERATSLL